MWMLVVLAALGFGGGLCLAVFSFNGGSDHGVRISSLAPELMYQPPAPLATDNVFPAAEILASAHAEHSGFAFTSMAAQPLAMASISAPHLGRFSAAGPREALVAEPLSLAPSALAASSAGDSLPQGELAAASAASFPLDYAPASAASAGLELPPIPEPSTWAMLLIGGGALLATLRNRRRPETDA